MAGSIVSKVAPPADSVRSPAMWWWAAPRSRNSRAAGESASAVPVAIEAELSIRPMRRLPATVLALACALALAGCGGDDETTTSAITENVHDPGAGAEGGPTGALTAEGIGEVEVGATEDEVEAAFGEPVDVVDVDLGGGGGGPPQVNWVYRFPEGDVTIKFDTEDDTFAAYDVHTPELETDDGFRVGDTDSELEKRYGDDLAGSPLGVHALVLSASKPGSAQSPALTFAIDGKKIIAISGGDVVQPAGE